MTYEEYAKKRKTIFEDSDNHKIITKKDRPTSLHVCALCGQLLTQYVPRASSYVALKRHYTYTYYNGVFHGSLCYNAKTCYRHIERRLTNGRIN